MTAYFDNNATTPMHREVLDAMLPFFREEWGNASSLHAVGRRARQAIEESRQQLAALLNTTPDTIVFTGSGTEANNLALRGVASALDNRGKHIITTAIEHHAVLYTAQELEKHGFEVSVLPVDSNGLVDPQAVANAVRDDTILVSIMQANNETGAIQPIAEIGRLLKDTPALFHTDAVQTVGKIPVDVNGLNMDLLSLSAHKFHGPQGVGALYVRTDTPLNPILFGGGQEERLRPGTYNVPGIVGLGAAAKLSTRSLQEDAGYISALTDRLEAGIRKLARDAVFPIESTHRLFNTLLVAFPGASGDDLVTNLDVLDIAASTGAACTTGSTEPSHVLRAMGMESVLADGAIRFSLGSTNSEQDIDALLAALKQTL